LKFEGGERDPVTGKRRTRYVTVRGTKKDAQRDLIRLLAEVESGTAVEPKKLTVAEYLEAWLADHAQHRVSAKTFERYAEIVHKHLIPGIGGQRLGKLSPLQIQAHYSALLTNGRRDGRGGLSTQTVKHHHRVLSQALRQAVRLHLISRNPAADVDPPRPVRREMKIIDPEQTATLLKAARERPALAVPVMLAITTGMRRGEILALRWADVDLDRASLSVTRTIEQTSKGLGLKEPKTQRSRRTITLPALAVDDLRRHRKRQAEALLGLGVRQHRDTLVCARPDSSPVSPRALTKAFALLVAELKLSIRFHDLRHSHLSHLLAAGVHPKVASERAGHASVSITLDLYSHLLPGMQEDAARRIDAALRTHLER